MGWQSAMWGNLGFLLPCRGRRRRLSGSHAASPPPPSSSCSPFSRSPPSPRPRPSPSPSSSRAPGGRPAPAVALAPSARPHFPSSTPGCHHQPLAHTVFITADPCSEEFNWDMNVATEVEL